MKLVPREKICWKRAPQVVWTKEKDEELLCTVKLLKWNWKNISEVLGYTLHQCHRRYGELLALAELKRIQNVAQQDCPPKKKQKIDLPPTHPPLLGTTLHGEHSSAKEGDRVHFTLSPAKEGDRIQFTLSPAKEGDRVQFTLSAAREGDRVQFTLSADKEGDRVQFTQPCMMEDVQMVN